MRLGSLLIVPLICLPTAAQTKPLEWKTAKVAEIVSSEDEIVKPRNRMVKRPGCQGGVGCYDSVPSEPSQIPTTVFVYRLEAADMTYIVR
jgi:hypothetical protein